MAMSRSGIRLPSSNTPPKNSPRRGCGRKTAPIARIQEIWTECRQRHGQAGPFLFGAFGGADAMFAPVVHRFRTYAIPIAAEAKAYMETMMALPAFREWTKAGLAETIVIDRFETV